MNKPSVPSLVGAAALTALLCTGCVSIPTSPSAQIQSNEALMQAARAESTSRSEAPAGFNSSSEPFVSAGALLTPSPATLLPDIFHKDVALSGAPETLQQLATSLVRITGYPVDIQPEMYNPPSEQGGGMTQSAGGANGSAQQQYYWTPHYSGTVYGLLNLIAVHFGGFWYYEGGRIVLARNETRVYTVDAAPGDWTTATTISNVGSSGTASGGSAGTSSGSTAMSSGQNINISSSISIWTTVKNEVSAMLTSTGKVSVNEASGTVTVTDTPAVQAQVAQLMANLNQQLTKQVSVTVRMFSLQLSSAEANGFSLAAAFENLKKDYQLTTAVTNPISFLPGVGAAGALVLPGGANAALGQWANTQALLKVLRQTGQVSSVMRGNGITRNNMPLPIQQTNSQTYIAEITAVAGVGTGVSGVTPGQAVTGFSMLATPHVLPDGRILLSYQVSVGILNSITNVSAGNGQQIGEPNLTDRSFTSEVVLHPGDTIVTVPFEQTDNEDDKASGVANLFAQETHSRQEVILMVTVNLLNDGASG